MYTLTNALLSYTVTYYEEDQYRLPKIFICWAENDSHAREQCENAYPEVEIVDIVTSGMLRLETTSVAGGYVEFMLEHDVLGDKL